MDAFMQKMLRLKIRDWQSIPYSVAGYCPNNDCDNEAWRDEGRNILGWCETTSGFMEVCECNKCFTKYRYRTGFLNFDDFADNFMLRFQYQNNRDAIRQLQHDLLKLYEQCKTKQTYRNKEWLG